MLDTPPSYSGPHPSRKQPSRFVDQMHQLFGEDSDPIFLEESWSLGVPAAIENLNRRRSHRAAYSSQIHDRALLELERMAALTATPVNNAGSFLENRAQPIDCRDSPAWLQSAAHHAHTPAADMHLADAHHLLGVSPCATREQIRSAWRRKVSRCHPDRIHAASSALHREATRQLADLNEAYRILCEHRLKQRA